jgi:hypothetical protein
LDIYGGRDPVELPAYSIPEVARLIRVPQATVRSWVLGLGFDDPSKNGLEFVESINLNHGINAGRELNRIVPAPLDDFSNYLLGFFRPLQADEGLCQPMPNVATQWSFFIDVGKRRTKFDLSVTVSLLLKGNQSAQIPGHRIVGSQDREFPVDRRCLAQLTRVIERCGLLQKRVA